MSKNVKVFFVLAACTLLLGYYSNWINTHNIPEPAGARQEIEEAADLDNLAIYIKNQSGEVVIQDGLVAINLINALRDEKRIVKIRATCPFGNDVVVRKKDEDIERFKIAGDGCFIALKEDNKIIKLPEDLYGELEKYMKLGDNSLQNLKKR